MKTARNYLLICSLLVILIGCADLEFFPANEITSDLLRGSPELLQNATIGNYSRLKEAGYTRHVHTMQEYMSDDIILSGFTSDHLMFSFNFQHIPTAAPALAFWRQAYWGIYGTNVVLEAIGDAPTSPLLRQMRGENLFLRAFMHFDLVRIFGRPYSHGAQNHLGVMIRNNTDVTALPPRATLTEVYDFILNDLLQAGELMTENKSASFATKEAAWALAARVYLFMGNHPKAIEYADKVINSGRYNLVSTAELHNYFRLTPEQNTETIFAIRHTVAENRGTGSIGSMYHADGGWGEIYVSLPYRLLLNRFPHDRRHGWIEPDFELDALGNRIPDPTETAGFRVRRRNGVPRYYNIKYTRQEGIRMLSSPVRIRLAEMFLIKAEAFAKTPGREADALNMVNIIRTRAGLSGSELFSLSNMQGYASVLDVVLDEKRLELAWEGHRAHDLFRNNRTMDRSYVVDAAFSGPRLIPHTSNLIVHQIPEAEITLNPNLMQNPLP